MAQTIMCEYECDQPALFLIGKLDNGQQTAACGFHIVDWARNLIAQFDAFLAEQEAAQQQEVPASEPVDPEGLLTRESDVAGPTRPARKRSPARKKPGTKAPSPSSNGHADDSVDAGEPSREGAS